MTRHTRRFRQSLFLTVYFVQGAILNYFYNFNSTYLNDRFGIGEGAIGMLGFILMLPFVLKVFIGMLSDKVSLFGLGHRKPYMLLGLLTQATGFFLVQFTSPAADPGLFLLAALMAVAGMALYDTTTDGFALDTTAPEEQGAIQSTMVIGRALGFSLLTPLIGIAASAWGWSAVFTGGALITLLPLALVARVREDPAARAGSTFQWGAFRAFGSRLALLFSLFGIISSLVIMALPPFLNLYFTGKEPPYLSIDLGTAGWAFFVMGIGRIAGAVSAGRMIDRVGIERSAWACLVVTGVACFGIAAVTWPGMSGVVRPAGILAPPVLALVFLGVLLCAGYSYYDTIYFCGAMRLADPAIYASMYAVFMAVGNLGAALGSPIAGGITHVPSLGFPAAALVIGLIGLANIPLIPRVFGSLATRKGAENVPLG